MRARWLTILPALFLASSASAIPTWWWDDGPSDDLWDTSSNWKNDTGSNGVPPTTIGEDAYITSSDHLPGDPTALVDATVDVDHPTLYIGGWLSAFDSLPSGDPHGDPHGHFGVLNITGGELHTAAGSCRYTRLGTRGARGTVNQSGGLYATCQSITLAYVGEDAVGSYNLSGGTVNAFSFDVGGQGTGIVDMTGGTIDNVGPTPRATVIASGVTHPDAERYQPGVGAFLLSGGTFKPENLHLGSSTGSSGILTVRGDSETTTFEALNDDDGIVDGVVFVGVYGHGSAVQSGGATDLGTLFLGRKPGGHGMYTLTGGELTVGNLYVGSGGTGNLVVGGGTVNVSTYSQTAGSRLTFIVNDTTPMVTTINVSGTASIPNGSVIDIDLANDIGTGFSVGSYDPVQPSCTEDLLLMTAQQFTPPAAGWESLLATEGFDGIPNDGTQWDLVYDDEASPKTLSARYVVCP